MADILIKKVASVDLTGYEVEALKTTRSVIEELKFLLREECCNSLITSTGLVFDETSLEDSLDIIRTILEKTDFEIEE